MKSTRKTGTDTNINAPRALRSHGKGITLTWRGVEVPAYYGRGTNRYAINGKIPGVVVPTLSAKQQESIGGALHAGFQLSHNNCKYLFNQNDCLDWQFTKQKYPLDGFEKSTEGNGTIRPMMSRTDSLEMSYDRAGECLDLANTLSEFWFHPGHPDRNAALAHMSHVCSTARTTRELYELLWTVPAQ